MSFVSLADACRELGIDVKTLHRWLAEAQLPLQRHREDGRKKGVSLHHLEQLAARHHRSLSARPSAAPQPTCCLPTELLALPEQLLTLQTQLAALQQQVRDLTRLIEPPAPPAIMVPPKRSCAQPAAPLRRQPAHVLPRLEFVEEEHYVVIAAGKDVLSLQADSPAWFAWLAQVGAFRFVGKLGHFTAHCDAARGTRIAWRAHRKIRNHTCNLRLGRTNELTVAVLEQAAATLQAHLK